jgi:hypothetical protein
VFEIDKEFLNQLFFYQFGEKNWERATYRAADFLMKINRET